MKKNHNYFKYIFWGLLFTPFLFTTSCLQDLGNYEYTEVDVIEVDTIGFSHFRRYQLQGVQNGDTLQLKPVVTYGNKDITKLEYRWFIYPFSYAQVPQGNTMVWPPADTISYEHELNWIVARPANRYRMQFTVRDPETGLKFIFGVDNWFDLNIATAGTIGTTNIIMLSEYDGDSDIDVYGPLRAGVGNAGRVWPAHYSAVHGDRIPGLPRVIRYATPNTLPGEPTIGTTYFTFTEETGLALNHINLMKMYDFNEMFYVAPDYNPQTVTFTNSCNFLLNNGKLHFLYYNQANDYKYSVPVAGDYRASPFLMRNTASAATQLGTHQIIFDELSNSFRPYFPRAASLGRLGPTSVDAALDANNLGHTPRVILEMNSSLVGCVMRINGKDSLYVFRFNKADDGDFSATGVANPRQSLEHCEGIADAKIFTSSTSGPTIFWATTNKVYSYSVTSGQTTAITVYTCEPGEEVTAMLRQPSFGGPSTAGHMLWIGVWDNYTDQGKVVEIEVNSTTGMIQTSNWAVDVPNPSVTGGFGKIRSMIVAM